MYDLNQDGIVINDELYSKQIYTTAQLNDFISKNTGVLSRSFLWCWLNRLQHSSDSHSSWLRNQNSVPRVSYPFNDSVSVGLSFPEIPTPVVRMSKIAAHKETEELAWTTTGCRLFWMDLLLSTCAAHIWPLMPTHPLVLPEEGILACLKVIALLNRYFFSFQSESWTALPSSQTSDKSYQLAYQVDDQFCCFPVIIAIIF